MTKPTKPTAVAGPTLDDAANPQVFSEKTFAWVEYTPDAVQYMADSNDYVEGLTADVDADATAVETARQQVVALEATTEGHKDDAEAAADASAVSANATAWVSGGSYTAGDVHWSLLNFASYRAKTTHSGLTTDPRDDTTNWAPVLTLTQATDATFLGHTQLEAVKEKRIEITGDATPELDVSAANVFTITTSANTSVSVINAPIDQAWLATVTVTLGGAHTLAFTGADWGDDGAPAGLASGDIIKVTLDGYGSTYDAFENWRKTA